MVSAWRICRREFARQAFDGTGPYLYGGRWNSPGLPVVYTSQALSLAALETRVHFILPIPPIAYVSIEIQFDQSWVDHFTARALPAHWRQHPPSAATQALGDAWLRRRSSAILAVPSAIIPVEFNYLVNPAHPDYKRIRQQPSSAFSFDPRLL